MTTSGELVDQGMAFHGGPAPEAAGFPIEPGWEAAVSGRWFARKEEAEAAMRAEVGDELVVRGRHVGDADRAGVVMEIHGHSGTPPYLVRWRDSHESLFTPSSDTHVEHRPAVQRRGG